jgi:hypothetical protein
MSTILAMPHTKTQIWDSLTSSANADLVDRLRSGEPLYKWDRSRFYGPFPDNEIGYTVHLERSLAKTGDISRAQLAD